MLNKTIICLAAMAFIVGTGPGLPSPASAQGSIELKSVVEMEVKAFNDEGQKVTVRKPAGKVVPGNEVIYTTYYTNIGNEPADSVVITNPVPDDLIFIDGSAAGKNTKITFSVDYGKTYDLPDALFIKGANGKKRPALASEYTHIKWELTKSLPPEGEGFVTFKAKLK